MNDQNRNTMHDAFLIAIGGYLIYLGIKLLTGIKENGNTVLSLVFFVIFSVAGVGIIFRSFKSLAKAKEEADEERRLADEELAAAAGEAGEEKTAAIESTKQVSDEPVSLFAKAMGNISAEADDADAADDADDANKSGEL